MLNLPEPKKFKTPDKAPSFISKTVYSFYFPETAEIIEDLALEFRHDDYQNAWTRKQDALHKPLFFEWERFLGQPSLPTVDFDRGFPHHYPTNGSSEAIRETLADFVVEGKQFKQTPRLHTFLGEYEGYKAFAEAYGIETVQHNRESWRFLAKNKKSFRPGDRFYISHPSSIDGNIWPQIDKFLKEMATHHPQVGIYLDLCYVGTTVKPVTIHNADLFNVQALFFSLSKVYGVYYHRIGGIYSRKALPGLYANMFFKNLFSLRVGTSLIRMLGNTLPSKYQSLQLEAVAELNSATKYRIESSDVLLLANRPYGLGCASWEKEFQRGPGHYRYCITPYLGGQNEESNSSR